MSQSLNQTLTAALSATRNVLSSFLENSQIREYLRAIFGEEFNTESAISWLESNFWPIIEIVPTAEINYANGAYTGLTNTIYIAAEFLASNQNVTEVILEEIGHFLDDNFNSTDSLGDEGALFAAIVQRHNLTVEEIAAIRAEDDSATIVLDGQEIAIEQANPGDNPAFDLIGLTQLRNDPDFFGIDGSGFSVAVIDTGIDIDHPLLAGNYLTGYDFFHEDNDPSDDEGHGTHVSGTIGANDERIGVAPDVNLIALQAGDRDGLPSYDIQQSLEWVLENHERYNIVAVNMSLGDGRLYTSESQAGNHPYFNLIKQLEEEGVVVVAAAGNDYEDYKDDQNQVIINQEQNLAAPAIFATIAVGAVWQDGNDPLGYYTNRQIPGRDRIAVFSQRLNTNNFLFAPGALINSTYPDDTFDIKPGTSMASPHVAGAVALLQEAALQFGGRLLTPSEVVQILRSTADRIIDGDDENDYVTNTGISYPRLNIYNAVVEVRRRFSEIGLPPDEDNSGDPNGTIIGAFIGPSLDGSPVATIDGVIGFDGNGTRIGDRDVDIFRFVVESPGNVTIELGSNTGNPADFDTYLRLFDLEGNELAVNDDLNPGVNRFSRIETFLQPGTYYAGVSGYNNNSYNPNVAGSGVSGATGNYSINFSLDNVDPNGLISGARDVNLGNDLDPLIFPGTIGADYGEAVGVSDVDLFRIVAPDNGVLLIDIDTPYQTDYVDSFLRLFDAEGNPLFFTSNNEPAENDDRLSFDRNGNATEFTDSSFPGLVFDSSSAGTLVDGGFDSNGNYRKGNYGHETDSFLGVIVERGQVYYIGVSDYLNPNYNPTNLDNRLEGGSGGAYELIVNFLNNDLDGTITQVKNLTALSPTFTREENIGVDQQQEVGDRDVDFFKINSLVSGILEIDIDAGITDTVVTIFDEQGRRLGLNDDNEGLDPLLRYQIAANTNYYVAVTGYGNQNFDPFGLGTGSGGDTGDYTIQSRLRSYQDLTILSDNTINSEGVENVAIAEAIQGNIGEDKGFILGASDIDLYRLIAPLDGTIDIRVGTTEVFSADTYLRLFDSAGNEIAANNNENNSTGGSFLRQEVTANSEYYIGINGYSDRARAYDPLTGENAAPGSQGDYTLDIGYSDTGVLGTAIYRFQNTSVSGTYLFVGEAERININQNFPNFTEEGLAFKVAVEQGDSLIPLYRFQSTHTPGTYLFVGEEERENINQNFSNSFTEEGLAFYVYGVGSDLGTPMYRFQNTSAPGTYLFATGEERTNILNNFTNFSEEGIAFEIGV